MPILQRNGRSPPLFHLHPGARPRILPAGLPVRRVLHGGAVLLDKSEDFGPLHSLSPGQALRPCSDISEIVNHILVSRKNSQAASLAKLAAVIRCSAEVAAKSFPNAGTSLSTWADRLRARSLPQDPPGTSPARSQAGDHMSWGHQMPPFNLSL